MQSNNFNMPSQQIYDPNVYNANYASNQMGYQQPYNYEYPMMQQPPPPFTAYPPPPQGVIQPPGKYFFYPQYDCNKIAIDVDCKTEGRLCFIGTVITVILIK